MIPVSLEDQGPFGLPDEIGAFASLDGIVDEVAGELLEGEMDILFGLCRGLELEDEVMRLDQLLYLFLLYAIRMGRVVFVSFGEVGFCLRK